MGKLGKETKNLLLAITVICLISFLLAAGLSFLLAKDFQHEMLLHDYGVSGYQLNHEDKLQISAFTAHPNESDIERGKEALASIGYSEATSMQLLPTVREYRNQTMLYLFLLLLFLFGMVYLVLLFYLRRQHRAIDDAGSKIREFLDGNSMSRIECSQTGDWYSLFHDVNEMATILSAHAESQKQTKEFLQDIISDVLGTTQRNNPKIRYTLNFDVTPHLLRHTYITNLLYAGVDPKTVQYLAGHENSKTTMDIYARVKYNKPEELFEVVNDALNQESFDEKSPISMVKE